MAVFTTGGSMSRLPSDCPRPVCARRIYVLVEQISGEPVDVLSPLCSNMTTCNWPLHVLRTLQCH